MKFNKNKMCIKLGLFFLAVLVCSVTLPSSFCSVDFTPNPPNSYSNAHWGVDTGYLAGWEKEFYINGTLQGKYSFYLNVTQLRHFYWNSTWWYILDGSQLKYNETSGEFEIWFNQVGLAMLNFTKQYYYQYPAYIIPLNSDGLMIDWFANAWLVHYLFNNLCSPNGNRHDLTIKIDRIPNNYKLLISNQTTGEYVNISFYKDGSMRSFETYFKHSDGGTTSEKDTRIYNFIPDPTGSRIPFGSWFLIFAIFACTTLVIITKKRFSN